MRFIRNYYYASKKNEIVLNKPGTSFKQSWRHAQASKKWNFKNMQNDTIVKNSSILQRQKTPERIRIRLNWRLQKPH